MATKIVVGEERIIYYHHEIAILTVTAFLLWLLKRPILPHLDVTVLAIGMFLVCGRVGCLMVGCCHGRPHRLGVCYGDEHAEEGFTSYYVGVRLFPIQAVESLWVFFIVATGSYFVLRDLPPGEAFAWYVVSYDAGRFSFEFLRGDPERPYFVGFSEPQWISFGLLCFVVWAEWAGLLIYHTSHVVVAASMGLTMMAVFLTRRYRRPIKYRLLNPKHVKSIAEAVERLSDATNRETVSVRQWPARPDILVEATPLGIQISASRVQSAAGPARLYSLSSQSEILSQEAAGILADLIIKLKHPGRSNELIAGSRGVFHLLVHPTAGAASSP